MPPCPSGELEPTIPGPGPQTAASQPSVRRPWCSAPTVVIASPSPPNAAPAVRCPASSPRSRSERTVRECPPGSAPPAVCTYPSRLLGRLCAKAQATARELAVQSEHRDRPIQWPTGSSAGCSLLDRLDSVLEARVVELHHVRHPRVPSPSRPRVRLTWTMSKPPEPRPRSRACTLTTSSSPTSARPTSATSAIAGRDPTLAHRRTSLDHEILLGPAPGGPASRTMARRSFSIGARRYRSTECPRAGTPPAIGGAVRAVPTRR